MARNQGPFIPDDESTPVSRPSEERGNGAPYRRGNRRAPADVDEPDVDRFAALGDDDEEGQQFRRAPRRVPVRRGPVTKKTAQRLKILLIVLIVVGVVASIWVYLYNYGKHSWRFRVESSDDIQITGTKHVSRKQVMEVMGGEIGKNVFFVRLEEDKQKLEKIPWVESASVMRFLPNHLRVDIRERVPVAFVRMGSSPELIDASGVVMNMPATKGDWSFPVITGMLDSEPLSTRAPRMRRYMELMAELEPDGYSKDIEEIDLSDPEDVKVSVSDSGDSILIHLGTSNFLDDYKLFKSHLQEWRQQYSNLKEVDLRYSGQVILNPGSGPENAGVVSKPPAASTVRKVRHRR